MAMELDPGRYDAAVELAEFYMWQNRFGDAATLLEQYTSQMQNSPKYLDRSAMVLMNIGLPGRAWPLLKRANELQPGVDSLQARLAECAVFVGEMDVARSTYAALLATHPYHQRNHYEYSKLVRARDDSHIVQMKEVLKKTQNEPERNIFLYYALAKELEDLEVWQESFEFYKKAGDAARSQSTYDVAADVDLVAQMIETCSAEWLSGATTKVDDSGDAPAPIFIVGLPRSGTTLTERILSSHSQVESCGESFFLRDAIKAVSGVKSSTAMSPEIVVAASTKPPQDIAKAYLGAIRYRLSGAPMFIEKLPENELFLGFIARAFPAAKLVLQVRNPMDSCFALYKQSYFRYAYSLDDLARYFVAHHQLVTHWRDVLGDRLVEVEYERMVTNTEHETRRLLDELGLDFEPACLEFEKNVAASNTASTVQVREKTHTRSVRRWTRYEKELATLREELQRAGIDID